MDELHLSYEGVEALVSDVKEKISEASEFNSELLTKTESVADSWEGKDYDAFSQKMNEILLDAQQELVNTGVLIDVISKSKEAHGDDESALASKAGGL